MKRKDTTPNYVKNTQTGVESKAGISLRWYHIAATVVVMVLVVVALVCVFTRFDLSIFSSRYTVKYALGCTSSFTGRVERSANSYHYSGASKGLMFGKKGITKDENEAYLKIIDLGANHVVVSERSYPDFEWKEQRINYGEERVVEAELAPDCMPGITYTINQ